MKDQNTECKIIQNLLSERDENPTSRIIFESHTIHDALHLIDQDTWLLVDLDNTLFQASQALGHVDWLLDEVSKRIELGMSRKDAFHSMYPLWKKTQMIANVIPVEEALIEVIQELQEKGIIVMGVTHREPFLASETLRQVYSLGIDFLKSTPSTNSFEFFQNERALYWEGILFVDTFNEKGEIFRSLLKVLGSKPKKIVFLDDKKKNVEELAEAAVIEAIGVYYTAIEQKPKIYSPDLARMQLNYFDGIISNEQIKLFSLNIETYKATNLKKKQKIPNYLYKIIPSSQWRESLYRNLLVHSSLDSECIQLATEEQLESILKRFKIDKDHMLLKIDSNRLIGRLIYETDFNSDAKYFRLYNGSIPLDAFIEARELQK